MQAIILAAGMGKRLKELTQNSTKCMVKVNGVTLIDRMLHQLEKQNLSRIVIVVGYEGKKLMEYIATLDIQTPITYVNNPIYDKTNNIYSLALAKEYLCMEDTLLFESDLIFEDSVIESLVNDDRKTLALVDKYESWMDGTCVTLREDDSIEAFIPGKKFKFNDIKTYYKTVNIYKFSQHFSKTCYVPFLDAYMKSLGENEYYEQVLRVITMLDDAQISAKRLDGQLWYEIDDIQDLDIAASMFMSEEGEKVSLIQNRKGGYWRYPKMIDFSNSANSYYPPQKLVDEIKANCENLVTQHPSGMKVNSLLAAKNFGVHQENILVGNEIDELFEAFIGMNEGKVGIIGSNFMIEDDRWEKEKFISYEPYNSDFSYSVQDLIAYFADKPIQVLLIMNPDDFSGNYILKKDMKELVLWGKKNEIQVVIDESFVDFGDEKEGTLLDQKYIEENPHLYIMKSISKAYGVLGLRLAIFASGDQKTISEMKKEIGVWNINSLAEFYMQIAEKYKKDYIKALEDFHQERICFEKALREIPTLRVLPSQTNSLVIELTAGMNSKMLTQKLLLNYNLLVTDLSEKFHEGQYVRIAIRNRMDNDKLVNALKQIFDESVVDKE